MTRPVLLLALLLPLVAEARDTTPPAMLANPATIGEDGVVTVEAQIVDDSGVFDPTVYWRVAGSKEFDVAKMSGDKQEFRATLTPPPGAAVLEYYIEAYDSEGNGPARFGAPNLPVKVNLAAKKVAAAPKPAPAAPKPAPAKPAPVAKAPPKPEVPAAAAPTATAQPAPDDKHEVEVRPPMPEWKFWSVIGTGVAGVALVAGGAVLLNGARSDASAFNARFEREGAYDDAQASSITNVQRGAVALMSVGVLSLAAGATLLTVDF